MGKKDIEEQNKRLGKFVELSTYNTALMRLDAKKGIFLAYFISAMVAMFAAIQIFIPNVPINDKGIVGLASAFIFAFVILYMIGLNDAAEKVYNAKMAELLKELKIFPTNTASKGSQKQGTTVKNNWHREILLAVGGGIIAGLISTALYAAFTTPHPNIVIRTQEYAYSNNAFPGYSTHEEYIYFINNGTGIENQLVFYFSFSNTSGINDYGENPSPIQMQGTIFPLLPPRYVYLPKSKVDINYQVREYNIEPGASGYMQFVFNVSNSMDFNSITIANVTTYDHANYIVLNCTITNINGTSYFGNGCG